MASARAVKFSLPPAYFFAAPHNLTTTFPPPPSYNAPLHISPRLWDQVLDIRVPITIATVYAFTVHILNSYASTTKPPTPYWFAKTKLFRYFVLLHNFGLAVYSAWTFIGISRALARTIPSIKGDLGFAGTIHGLCNIGEQNNGSGLWQDGLAFYGWFFYLSKFYEVIDTAIILAKGRKSSTLQTYHHAGAMAAMYIGIKYMSPPVFIWVLFNSFIHSLMYAYYTLSALHIRIPNILKRCLTTMQISQFVIGGSWAASYLFITYVPPLNVATTTSTTSSSSSSAATAASTTTSTAGKNSEFVTCLSSSGEAWAVLANVVYLTPLTYLFVMFFIRSYITPNVGSGKAKQPTKLQKQAVAAGGRKPVIGQSVAA